MSRVLSAFPKPRRDRLRDQLRNASAQRIDCSVVIALLQELERAGVRYVEIEKATLIDILNMIDKLESIKTIDGSAQKGDAFQRDRIEDWYNDMGTGTHGTNHDPLHQDD